MAVLTFRGGVHPPINKSNTADQWVIDVMPKEDLVFPLFMHHGLHAKPIVSGGEWVGEGSLIAKADGYVSSNVHSSIAGIVKYVDFNTICIENSGERHEVEPTFNNYKELTNSEIISLIRESGVVGMGGEEGYPTHIKLQPEEPDKIEYIIVNGCECEPYITCNYRRLMEDAAKVVEGLKIVLRLFPNAKGVIAIEDDKKDAIRLIKDYSVSDTSFRVKMVYTKYPQGSERQLIKTITGREMNSKMKPADVRCLVLNVETVYAIRQAVVESRALISRIVTISGDAIRYPGNYNIRFGTSIKEAIEAAGGFIAKPEKLLIGGPMTGESIFDLSRPISKDVNAILAFSQDPVINVKQTNCIRCGRCLEVCPEGLIPTNLADYAALGNLDYFVKYDGKECVACGSCSYICPAKRSLAELIITTKRMLTEEV